MGFGKQKKLYCEYAKFEEYYDDLYVCGEEKPGGEWEVQVWDHELDFDKYTLPSEETAKRFAKEIVSKCKTRTDVAREFIKYRMIINGQIKSEEINRSR